ncbi:MAG: hypothetical protein AAFY60_21920, partial [Myxococcota bacterium]
AYAQDSAPLPQYPAVGYFGVFGLAYTGSHYVAVVEQSGIAYTYTLSDPGEASPLGVGPLQTLATSPGLSIRDADICTGSGGTIVTYTGESVGSLWQLRALAVDANGIATASERLIVDEGYPTGHRPYIECAPVPNSDRFLVAYSTYNGGAFRPLLYVHELESDLTELGQVTLSEPNHFSSKPTVSALGERNIVAWDAGAVYPPDTMWTAVVESGPVMDGSRLQVGLVPDTDSNIDIHSIGDQLFAAWSSENGGSTSLLTNELSAASGESLSRTIGDGTPVSSSGILVDVVSDGTDAYLAWSDASTLHVDRMTPSGRVSVLTTAKGTDAVDSVLVRQ